MHTATQSPTLSLVPNPSERRGACASAPGSSADSPNVGALSGSPIDLVERHERLVIVKERAIRHWRRSPSIDALDRRFQRCVRLMDLVAASRVDLAVLVWRAQEVAR